MMAAIKRKKKWVSTVGILVAVFCVAFFMFMLVMGGPRGPKPNKLRHLTVPHVTEMTSMKMIVVRAQGAPNDVGRAAFGLLMSTYFKCKGVPKGGPSFKAPRARWPIDAAAPQQEWVGLYAIPVPEHVTGLPPEAARGDLSAKLVTWDYGTVAQILHVGPYSEETPTIEALKTFIDTSGYEIAGDHEEEYLRGPGIMYLGDPSTYCTLIRYQVRKKEPAPDSSAG